MVRSHRSKRASRLLVLALAGLFAAGCSGSDSPTSPAALAGTWVVVTVNGQPLPVVIFEDAFEVEEVTAASLTLNQNGSCSFVAEFRLTEKDSGEVFTETDVQTCTFTVSGNTVTMDFGGGDVETATVAGNSMTLVLGEGAFVLVLQKQ